MTRFLAAIVTFTVALFCTVLTATIAPAAAPGRHSMTLVSTGSHHITPSHGVPLISQPYRPVTR